jgi:hypothetical protein
MIIILIMIIIMTMIVERCEDGHEQATEKDWWAWNSRHQEKRRDWGSEANSEESASENEEVIWMNFISIFNLYNSSVLFYQEITYTVLCPLKIKGNTPTYHPISYKYYIYYYYIVIL